MILNIPCRSNPMPYYVGTIDYSTMPLTFECVSGNTTLRMPLMTQNSYYSTNNWGDSNSPITSLFAKVDNGEWFDWKAQNFSDIALTAGQKVQLSGNNGYGFSRGWNYWNNRFRYTGTGRMIVYGNLSSVINPSVSAINLQNIWYQGESGYQGEQNNILEDASKLIIPFAPYDSSASFEGSWGFNVNLSAIPLFTSPVYKYSMFGHALKGNTSLRYIEMSFETNSFPSFDGGWMMNISQSGYFIKSPNLAMPTSRSQNTVPSNWVILNRMSNGTLQYAEAKEGHAVGDTFTGYDPYAWYYTFHKPNR